jgi:hypothetical protein
MAKGADTYKRFLRSEVRALWLDVTDYQQFFEGMLSTIRGGLTAAWREGMESVGLTMEDRTPEEIMALQTTILNEVAQVFVFGQDIMTNSKANGGKLTPLLDRANRWSLRYQDVMNHARQMAGNDPKLEWVHQALGPTVEPCDTCAIKLNGKVKRANHWRDNDIRPQNPPNSKLDCGGWG